MSQELHTYFFVRVYYNDNRSVFTYGPYISPTEAAEIMMNHIPDIMIGFDKEPSGYKAELEECLLVEGNWEPLNTTLTTEG